MSNTPITKLDYQCDPTPLIEIWQSLPPRIQHNVKYAEKDVGKSVEDITGMYIKGTDDYLNPADYKYHLFSEIEKLERDILKLLPDNIGLGRARFMTLEPRTCYRYHSDPEPIRLHIPLITRDNCMFIVDDIVYRMDIPGQLYALECGKKHTALNAQHATRRVHLMFCGYYL